ncbi:hypothetical protein N9335_03345 [Crocinitomicaceae bacterium]|nr:hypothetical protein [Crocinitomicaceae bacterium]
MIKSKIIYAWMLSAGIVQPMHEKNNDRELYILYVIDAKTEQVYAYEHAYEEEIMEYIESGDFEYESNLKVKNEK